MGIRVALICGLDIRRWRGGERFAVELARALIERGHSVTIFSKLQNGGPARLTKSAVQKGSRADVEWFRCVTIGDGAETVLVSPSLFKKLTRFDSIYCIDSSSLMNAYLAIFCKVCGIRFVHGMHTPVSVLLRSWSMIPRFSSRPLALYKKVYKRLFSVVPSVHVLREDVATQLRRSGFRGEIQAIPNFVYWDRPQEASGTPKPVFQVLWVGELMTQSKGIDILCQVVTAAISRDSRIQVCIVGGSGDGRPQVQTLASAHPETVSWKEFISDEELQHLYRTADLFLSTSRFEGFALTVLEAQAYGLPCVGLDIPGVRGVLSESSYSSMADPAHPERLADLVVSKSNDYFTDPVVYAAHRRSIQDRVQEEFGKERIVPMLEKMLSERVA